MELSGNIKSPEIEPGNKGALKLDLPDNWKEFDVLYLTAKDHYGYEIFTWSYEINSPAFFTERIIKQDALQTEVDVEEDPAYYKLSAGGVTVKISKTTGLLENITNSKGIIPLTNGPVFITDKEIECKKVSSSVENGSFSITAIYNYAKGREAYRFIWTMQNNGILQLDHDYRPLDNIEMSGITFDFPEKDISGAKLFANGPYRVYNNRMKGGSLNIWDKEYNDGAPV